MALSEAYDSGLPAEQFPAFSGDPANLTLATPRESRYRKSD